MGGGHGSDTILISHDMVRMQILYVRSAEGIKRPQPLMIELLKYGRWNSGKRKHEKLRDFVWMETEITETDTTEAEIIEAIMKWSRSSGGWRRFWTRK